MEKNDSGIKSGRTLKGRAWGKLVCTETFAALRLRGQEAALGVDDKGSELVVDVKASDVRLKIKQVMHHPFLPSHPSVAPSLTAAVWTWWKPSKRQVSRKQALRPPTSR